MIPAVAQTRSAEELAQHRIESLRIVVLHVHSRCNCRCVMCDIWQSRRTQELSPKDFERMLPSFESLGVRWVVLTGGEPLLHSNLAGICQPLRKMGIKVTLLTTGLLLFRYADATADLFDEITISIDGPAAIHNQIRRIPGGFERIADGIASLRRNVGALPMHARTTVQKANHRHLCETVRAVQELGLDSISFLASDLTSTAFNRELIWPVARQEEVGLSLEEASQLGAEIEALISTHETELNNGFIVESPAKLRGIVRHFRTHLGLERAVAPLCTAPWHSAVVELDGSIRPCFFQPSVGSLVHGSLEHAINDVPAMHFRANLDIPNDATCQRCVCSLNYRVS